MNILFNSFNYLYYFATGFMYLCLDLFGRVLGIFSKYMSESVTNDLPYVTLQKTELLDCFS